MFVTFWKLFAHFQRTRTSFLLVVLWTKNAFKLRPCWIFYWNVQFIWKLIFEWWVMSDELMGAIYQSAYLCAFISVFWRWKVLHGNSEQRIFCGSRSCQTGIQKKARGKWCVFHQRDNGCYGGGRSYHVWLPALWCRQSFHEKCKRKWYESCQPAVQHP